MIITIKSLNNVHTNIMKKDVGHNLYPKKSLKKIITNNIS